MSNTPQQFNGGEYVDKARDAARDHPEQARSAIDKVQDVLNQRTGGKYESVIDKAGDFVEDKIGLPQDKGTGESPAPQDKSTGESGQAPAPQDTKPAPQEAPAPAPQEAPAPEAPKPGGQPGSTGGGVLPG